MSSSGQNPHYPCKGHAGKCHGKGDNGSGNPDGRGGLNLKLHTLLGVRKVLKKLLCVFKFYYSFKLQTSYHLYFKFPSIRTALLLV